MMTKRRAEKGGEYGANGEFYEGGKFINTTPENAKNSGSKRRTGKREIAPYVWEVAPEGKRSLYAAYRDVFARITDGIATIRTDQGLVATCKHLCITLEQAKLMVDQWNAGVRWI